jgi:iron complex outermembrane receptor protein
LQSLLLRLSVISVGAGLCVRVASAQPTPSDTPADNQADNPTTAQPPADTPTDKVPLPASGDTGTISGTIRSPDLEAPLSGATVTIEGTNITATTDESGHFQMSAPPGRVTVRADFSGFRSVQKQVTISAGKTADIDVPMTLDQLLTEVVVVVGSRTPRTNVETTAPVDVVTAEEISHVGKTQTGRVLATLAPSYVSTPQTVSDGTDHVDPASLRGLGPDQVLVLVNGKRRHKSALLNVNGTFGRGTVGTDLNAIPAGSIKRIEILRDGAASQYGSDAIAGVINIVTKDYADLFDVTTTTGITGSGDGGQIKTSANYGFKLGKRGFLNLTGEFLKKDPTNRTGVYTGNVYTSPTGKSPNNPNGPDPMQVIDNQILQMKGKTREDFKMKIGEASSEDAIGSYNLEMPIDDTATFYSFGDLAHRSGGAAGFYRFPNQFGQNVQAFYPDGFLPEIHSNINDLGLTIGVRRKGDWTIDASLTHGRNSFQFNIENSVNASLGTLSPTTFNAGTLSSQETVGDLDLQRKLDTGGVLKSLALVLGTEVRSESYKIGAGDPPSYEFGLPGQAPAVPPDGSIAAAGAQVFPGFQPSNEVDRDRNNVGVYGGFESEVVKGLNVDLGGRYENYNDFGNSFTGKAAARVPVGKVLAIRGAASTGFRAPSLQQLWFNNISTRFIVDPASNMLVPNQVLTSNNASPITKAFGIPKLREEKSTNFSGGITLRPFDNLSVTADAYLINIKNRIVLTSTFPTTNAVVKNILAPFPGVTQAQFFGNAVDTETRGLDLVADYAIEVGHGTVMLSTAANFTRTLVQDVHIPDSLMKAFGNDPALKTFFFGRLATSQLEDSVPRQKGYASIRYNLKGLSALVRANYYGRVRLQADSTANDEMFSAKTLFDVDLGYQFTKNLQVTVGADNVLDTFPDKQTKAVNISAGRFIYSRAVSQFGQNGGFYYGKLELTFF